MKDKTLSIVLMAVYGVAGIGTGLIFGRAQYHKGKRDAYMDASDKLKKSVDEVKKMINKLKEES